MAILDLHHAVSEVQQGAVVGHQHGGGVHLLGDIAQEADDFLREVGIERGGGLIGQEQVRLLHERSGDIDALALATGQLTHAAIAHSCQADKLQ